jgi:predicted nucleic acid-binding Zn ribbon protein
MRYDLKPTSYCWQCGMPSATLFCRPRCEVVYNRRYKRSQEKAVFEGKRRGYGLLGSTR